jgi:hypothetical protein
MEHQVDKLRVAQRERMKPHKGRWRRGKRGSVPALASKTDLRVLDASGVMPR